MKIHATPGDIYMFGEHAVITYVVHCAECDKPWQPPQREFVTAEARDKWAANHADYQGHRGVTRSTWLIEP